MIATEIRLPQQRVEIVLQKDLRSKWLPSEPKLPCSNRQSVFAKIMVTRTVATWCTSDDGAVQVQVANPSSEHVALPAGLKLGSLSLVNITTINARLLMALRKYHPSQPLHRLPLIARQLNQNLWNNIPELLTYMDDLCVLSATWESHINSLENLFAALQEAGLT